MKVAYLSVGLLALLTPVTAAWNKDDREIFRIRDEIAAHEADPAATFYDILGIKSSASFDDITKAYRLRTKALHPDKVKQRLKAERAKAGGDDKKKAKAPSKSEVETAVKEASDAQARLSLIANILKGPGRDRYDHFLSSGFPLWKGTDYYYDRYRPGIGTVLVGLFFVAGGGIHYLTLYMSWKRQKEFLDRYIKFARDTAWGSTLNIPAPAPVVQPDEAADDDEAGPPQPVNRRQRRMQEKESKKESGRVVPKKKKAAKNESSTASSRSASAAPTGARKRVVAENGKVLVVDSLGDVYLEDVDEDGNVNEFLLDPNELVKPTIWDTAVFRVPIWAFHMTQMTMGFESRNGGAATDATDAKAGDADEDSDEGPAQHTPSTDSAGEDFELVSKSTDSLSKMAAKASGAQSGGKANKRKGRKK